VGRSAGDVSGDCVVFVSNNPSKIESPEAERYVIIAGGDGYGTATVTGRDAMEKAFVRAHWPDADFAKLDEEQQRCLDYIRDEDEWEHQIDLGRVKFFARYECDWVEVIRLTDDLVGSQHETSAERPTWRDHKDEFRTAGALRGAAFDLCQGLVGTQHHELAAQVHDSLCMALPLDPDAPIGRGPQVKATGEQS